LAFPYASAAAAAGRAIARGTEERKHDNVSNTADLRSAIQAARIRDSAVSQGAKLEWCQDRTYQAFFIYEAIVEWAKHDIIGNASPVAPRGEWHQYLVRRKRHSIAVSGDKYTIAG
jgi:hypothetical protein